MKSEQFEGIINAQIDMIKDVLIVKAKEYATEDRLHNFRTVATLRDCTMEQALGGMLSKHTVSIYDMIESGKEYTSAQWDEKITDHINYLLILKAIIVEREEGHTSMVGPGELYSEAVKSMQEFAKQACYIYPENYDAPVPPEDAPKIMYNHDPSSTNLTVDEMFLAMEIKELLTKHKICKDNGIVR